METKKRAVGYNVLIEVVEPKEQKVGKVMLLNGQTSNKAQGLSYVEGIILSTGANSSKEFTEGDKVVATGDGLLIDKSDEGDVWVKHLMFHSGDILMVINN